jgi:hypothetical protein
MSGTSARALRENVSDMDVGFIGWRPASDSQGTIASAQRSTDSSAGSIATVSGEK